MEPIKFNMIEEDFDSLCHTSMRWGKDWERQKNRFDPEPSFEWSFGYWVSSYVEVMFCRAYLTTQGFETQTVFDTAINSYLVLTDFTSSSWRD